MKSVIRVGLTIVCIVAIFNSCLDAVNDIPPFIQSISPTVGTANTQVTIKGTDFEISPTANTVKFNGKTAIIVSGNPFELVVLVPENAGTGKVSVTTSSGTTEGPEFKYLNALTIASVDPLSGRAGDQVTITGENFDDLPGGTIVRFNGSAANVISLTTTQVVVSVPEGAGTGKITVRTGAGVVEGPAFEYLFSAVVSTYAGDGTAGFANGNALEARFNLPTDMVFDQSNNLYVCDSQNNLIRLVTPEAVVSTFAGSGSLASVDGNGIAAQFARPNFITVNVDGNLFVTESFSGNIRKIAADAEVTTLAGSGSNGYSDGTGTGASFNTPAGLVINPQGLFFVGDQGNTRVRQMTSIGEVSTLAGNSTPAYTDGTGTGASFMSPYGLAVDNVGEIIVADLNKIRRVNLDGVVTTFTGKETAGWIDGTLETAEFNGLRGVARWKNDFIIVADGGNHVIRMITPAGTVITIAGDGTSGYVNGNGHEAKFNFPNGISVNSRNEIFVADRLNHVIRKIVLK